jgi:hypothetical protein
MSHERTISLPANREKYREFKQLHAVQTRPRAAFMGYSLIFVKILAGNYQGIFNCISGGMR